MLKVVFKFIKFEFEQKRIERKKAIFCEVSHRKIRKIIWFLKIIFVKYSILNYHKQFFGLPRHQLNYLSFGLLEINYWVKKDNI